MLIFYFIYDVELTFACTWGSPHCVYMGQPRWDPCKAWLHSLFRTHKGIPNRTQVDVHMVFGLVICLTSRSTICQSFWDGATVSWVFTSTLGTLKCIAQGHYMAFEPWTSRSRVRSSTPEPPRPLCSYGNHVDPYLKTPFQCPNYSLISTFSKYRHYFSIPSSAQTYGQACASLGVLSA